MRTLQSVVVACAFLLIAGVSANSTGGNLVADFRQSKAASHRKASPETTKVAMAYAGHEHFHQIGHKCSFETESFDVNRKDYEWPVVLDASEYPISGGRALIVINNLHICDTTLWNKFSVLALFVDGKPAGHLANACVSEISHLVDLGPSRPIQIVGVCGRSQMGTSVTTAQLIEYANDKFSVKTELGVVRWDSCGVGSPSDEQRASVVTVSRNNTVQVKSFRKSCKDADQYKYVSDKPLFAP
jgi:hypothetical protein